MRFENSALQSVRIDSRKLNDLRCGGESAHDPNGGNRQASQFC
jgi:hypothetical protein